MRDQFPMVQVDWCDAAAFCVWAGKRLCATYGGDGDIKASAYESTCTDGGNDYRYDDLKQGACNGGNSGPVAAVKSFTECVTPTLVYDLAGNVAEWTAECDGAGCRTRGGSYADTNDAWGCEAARSAPRTYLAPTLGFRCCADEI